MPRKRILLKSQERARLLSFGRDLGPAIRQVITIVDYSTFRRWVRKEDGLDAKSGRGRPRIAMVIRELVVRMARETGWGYTRILGELRKLGMGRISRQTVKNILRENGFEPGPKRDRGTWSEFLKIHADTLWQIDFFSKRIWTLQGPRQAFSMAFLHVATHRVFVTPSTCKPDAGWMKAQANGFFRFAEERNLGCEILIRDLDGKYSSAFDRCFTDRCIKVKPVGPRAPNMNAYIERWIQSLKHEALNNFVIFRFCRFGRWHVKFTGPKRQTPDHRNSASGVNWSVGRIQ